MATKADNKEGSCKQILTGPKKGKWRVQYTVADALGRKKRLSRLFPRQTDGKDFLRSLKRADATDAMKEALGETLANGLNGWQRTIGPMNLPSQPLPPAVPGSPNT